MAANTQLPVLPELGVSSRTEKEKQSKSNKTRKLLSRLQLGSLQPVPQPGDVHYPHQHNKHPRPLGLIPNRNDRLSALKKLNKLFSAQWDQQPSRPDKRSLQADSELIEKVSTIGTTISAAVQHSKLPPCKHVDFSDSSTAYRCPQNISAVEQGVALTSDPDYMPIDESAIVPLGMGATKHPLDSHRQPDMKKMKLKRYYMLPNKAAVMPCTC